MVSPVKQDYLETEEISSGEAGQKTAISALYGVSITGHGNQEHPTTQKNEDDDAPFTLHNFVFFLNTKNCHKKKQKKFITDSDTKNSFKAFHKFVCEKNLLKLPWRDEFKILYKVGLLIFFVINFLYPIIAFAIKTEHIVYNIVCGIISLVGLVIELFQTIPDIYHNIKKWKQRKNKINPTALVVMHRYRY